MAVAAAKYPDEPICFIVPREDLAGVRDAVFPLLLRGEAVDGGRSTAEGIWEEIENQKSQLWLVTDGGLQGICVTAIVNHPGLRACVIQLCAGENVKEWIHMLREDVEPWARDMDCEAIEGFMRKGWARLLPDFKTRRVFMEKDLR